MRRFAVLLIAAASVLVVGSVMAATPEPTTPQEWCRVVDVATGDEVTVPCYRDPVTTTTTVTPTSTTSTTVEPSTTVPSTTTSTTVATTEPSPGGFVETFDGNTGLDRFDTWVYHRNVDLYDFWSFSGGDWTGDHDLACGSPATQRPLSFTPGDEQAVRRASLYTCKDHMMTSMGDVDGYSIVAFSPAQTFGRVESVSFDVNLTDLGTRQWWKVGVVSTAACPVLDQRCMFSDVSAADLPTSLATSTRLIATWSGGASAGYPGGLKIGNTSTSIRVNPTPNDKMTRHPVSLVDNRDGTVTFTVAGVSVTRAGAFPACPCRVVFYDHNYTPTKSESGYPQGFTWHWDNIVVD